MWQRSDRESDKYLLLLNCGFGSVADQAKSNVDTIVEFVFSVPIFEN